MNYFFNTKRRIAILSFLILFFSVLGFNLAQAQWGGEKPAPVIALSDDGSTIIFEEGWAMTKTLIMWSKNKKPTYPYRDGDRVDYFKREYKIDDLEAFSGYGTYYVRVCYEAGRKCGPISNELKITLGEKGPLLSRPIFVSIIFLFLMIVLICLIEFIFWEKIKKLNNKILIYLAVFLLLFLLIGGGYLFYQKLEESSYDPEVATIFPGKDEMRVIRILDTPGYENKVSHSPIVIWDVFDDVFQRFELVWSKYQSNSIEFEENNKTKDYFFNERLGEITPYRGSGSYYFKVCGYLNDYQKICSDSRMVILDAPFYYDWLGGFLDSESMMVILWAILVFVLVISFFKILHKKGIALGFLFFIKRVNKYFVKVFFGVLKKYKNVFLICFVLFMLLILVLPFYLYKSNDKETGDNNIKYLSIENFEVEEVIEKKDCMTDGGCSNDLCSNTCLSCYSSNIRQDVLQGRIKKDKYFDILVDCLEIDPQSNIKDIFLMEVNGDQEREIGVNTSKGFSVLKYEQETYKPIMKKNVFFDKIVNYNHNGKDQILSRNNVLEYMNGEFVSISTDLDAQEYCSQNEEYNCLYNQNFSVLSPSGEKIAWLPSLSSAGMNESLKVQVKDNLTDEINYYQFSSPLVHNEVFKYLRWEDENNIIVAGKGEESSDCTFFIKRIILDSQQVETLLEYITEDFSECESGAKDIIDLADNLDKILPFFLSRMELRKEAFNRGDFDCDMVDKTKLSKDGYEFVGGCLYKDGENILKKNVYGLMQVGFFGREIQLALKDSKDVSKLFSEKDEESFNIYFDLNYEKGDKEDNRLLKIPYLKIDLETGEMLRGFNEFGKLLYTIISPHGDKAVEVSRAELYLRDLSDPRKKKFIYSLPGGTGMISEIDFKLIDGAVEWSDNNTVELSVYKSGDLHGVAEPINDDRAKEEKPEYEQIGVTAKIDLSKF